MSDTQPRPDDPGDLIRTRDLRRMAGGISSMTVWRWRKAELLPAPTKIRGRNYWTLAQVSKALADLVPAAEQERIA